MKDDDVWVLMSRRRFLALAGAATAIAASRGVALGAETGETPSRGPGRPSLTPAQRARITTVRVHPGVGVMRVGNSADAFYFGPDVPGAIPPHGTTICDGAGAIARQAARFRVFGYDAGGHVVGEVTDADGTINWGVHLANCKAAWYQFSRALDIPEATSAARRNASISGSHRDKLVLDAGLQTTHGTHVKCKATAMGITMLLGEIMTDAAGRLVVLPGHGAAKSWTGGGVYTFANNNGWLDDMADGPVTARVTLGGRTLRADPAWVIAGPPNYAPGIPGGWRTLYDVLEDVWVSAGMLGRGPTVSFRHHILPMFTRLARLQWLNAGILRDYGWHAPEQLDDPTFLARLADASPGNAAFRSSWQKRFRDLSLNTKQPDKLPPILGDAAAYPINSPRHWIGTTALQRARLKKWADGNFVSDGTADPIVSPRLSDVPLQQRPGSLDRAALDACLGDAFLPGCEVTWPMRHASMWRKPFRLRVRSNEPDYGSSLTKSEAVSKSGPIAGNFPGSVLRWMALPWMTDTIDCRAGYDPSEDPYLDTFWPARVPNHVLRAADYATVMDTSASLTARKHAFRRREDWWRGVLSSDRGKTLNGMVKNWYRLGFVVLRPGPSSGPFPDVFGVEISRTLAEPAADASEPPNLLPDFDHEDDPGG